MQHFTPVTALAGGLLLGVASSLLYVLYGRILGISGIVGGLPGAPAGDRVWRAVFIAGLLSGGVLAAVFAPGTLSMAGAPGVPLALVAGVAVGVGTRLSNGCTSGHGLCGIARLSPRSITATGVFMVTGALTVLVARHLLHLGTGGAS